MPSAEQDEEDAILAECHKRDATGAVWCMRDLHPRNPAFKQGRCAIMDSRYFTPRIVVQAETWSEILAKLKELP